MNTADLAVRLDSSLHVDRFPADDFEIIVESCQEAGIRIAEYATPAFLHRFNGVMLNNADEEHRPQFDAFVETVPLNPVGASHYATEALVLREEMLAFFADLGLAAEFVPQADPWR